MNPMLVLFIGLCFSPCLNGQSLSRAQLIGNWTTSTGQAGRTIQTSDSGYFSLLPITYSRTTLNLRRCGRAVLTTQGFHGMAFDSKYKGRWTIHGDTLCISFKRNEEVYLIDRSIEERIFLNSITSNGIIYGRVR